ncbi:MAG: cold shock domain-containing protein [Pseudomonadales bacterium]|nr:cold shock domain-containing protein [Pseudomonadales bacterium]
MNFKGRLVRWNEERGFGFIKSDSVDEDIFIHISVLKNMNRRPVVGDLIYFELAADKNGRKKAVRARIEGVAANVSSPGRRQSFMGNKVFIYVLFAGLVVSGYVIQASSFHFGDLFSTRLNSEPVFQTQPAERNNVNFKCEGKQYCRQMTSCDEALFYLRYCPDVKIDGDGDGIPCESQHCL